MTRARAYCCGNTAFIAITSWDSVEKIKAWRANPEYIEIRKIGDKYATFRSFAVEGLPQ